MMGDDSGLHMLRLELHTPRLFALMRQDRLSPQQADMGYSVHCQLVALFGELAPKPFTFDSADRRITVLGYSSHPMEVLADHARTYADPLTYALVDWSNAVGKPMPSAWTVGLTLRYLVDVCPTIRKASAGEKHRAGAEVDVFLARCWDADDPALPVDRAAAYADWLIERVASLGGAEIIDVKMTQFKRQRVARLTQCEHRRPVISDRPQARLEGSLRVGDSAAFKSLLRRGIGRHRAFGLGMLLLSAERS